MKTQLLAVLILTIAGAAWCKPLRGAKPRQVKGLVALQQAHRKCVSKAVTISSKKDRKAAILACRDQYVKALGK